MEIYQLYEQSQNNFSAMMKLLAIEFSGCGEPIDDISDMDNRDFGIAERVSEENGISEIFVCNGRRRISFEQCVDWKWNSFQISCTDKYLEPVRWSPA